MEFSVDVWLRGDNHATTQLVSSDVREPDAWTEGDVANVLARRGTIDNDPQVQLAGNFAAGFDQHLTDGLSHRAGLDRHE